MHHRHEPRRDLPAAAPSASARSAKPTPRAGLDRAVNDVRGKAAEFARLDPASKAALLRDCVRSIREVAQRWVAAACAAKGIPSDAPVAGEEWLAGPVVTIRNARLLAESLDQIALGGRPTRGLRVARRDDGRVSYRVFPTSGLDAALFSGFSAEVLALPGVRLGGDGLPDRQAGFYTRAGHDGEVALVLGAGNVSSIPPMDCFSLMFVEGCVCVLKMNPVNEWLGPFLEQALAPLVWKGYLAIVYGGAEEGSHLCAHPGVDRIHITGSDRTHDLIVWGPPGEERERRKRENDPVLRKRITSELGNVSPVCIVPGEYAEGELWFMARNVAAMVANNGSFNCNAAKLLVVADGWSQRKRFHEELATAFMRMPTRLAYYPGAHDRYRALTEGRGGALRQFGEAKDGHLPWTFIRDLDPADADEPLFRTEPFCGLLSETALPAADAGEFLGLATAFCNDRVWGTLNATVMVPPSIEGDPRFSAELDRAVLGLRYGTVAINHWPALGYGFVSPPWGGHPGATLADVQSGIGWVHNTFMLEDIEKTVVRGPLTVRPKPAWFPDNASSHVIGRRLAAFEASPRWWKVPAVAVAALRG